MSEELTESEFLHINQAATGMIDGVCVLRVCGVKTEVDVEA